MIKSETSVSKDHTTMPSHTQPDAGKPNSSERSASGEGNPIDLQIAQSSNATTPQDRTYLNFTPLRFLADIAIRLATCCCKKSPPPAIHDNNTPNQRSNNQSGPAGEIVSQIMNSPVGSIGQPTHDNVSHSHHRTDTMEKLKISHIPDTPPDYTTALSTIRFCQLQSRTADQDLTMGTEPGVIKIAFPSADKIKKIIGSGKNPIQYIQRLQTLHKNEVKLLERLKQIPDYDRFFVTHCDAWMSQKRFGTPETPIHAYTMQRYQGGDLVSRIDDLSHRQIIDITIVLLGGLYKLKNACIIHRDLKPDNIFLDSENRARISDFGLAAFRDKDLWRKAQKRVGTPSYQAPEVTNKHKNHNQYLEYPYAVDMFSLGATLYTLLQKETLPRVEKRLDATPMCQFNDFDTSISAPEGEALIRFINDCLSHNPGDRPIADSALEDFEDALDA